MATKSLKRWDEAQARRIISRADRSGLSDRAFSRREGFDAQRLSWWRRRLEQVGGASTTAEFVEVRAKAPATVGDVIEIAFANGRIARVSTAIDPAVLARLLTAIEGRSC
jgi:hypothetical protein